jgi:hypothetical protein
MRRRPLNRPVAPAVAVAALVAVAVGVVAFAGVSRTGPEQAGNSPSASAPVSGTPGAPSPDHGPVLHGSPPPEPVATPDADQAALVAKGWTFRAVRTLGVSMAVPPGWVSASWGDGRIADIGVLNAIAADAPRYKPFLDSVVTAMADGSVDLVAVDAAPATLRAGGGAVLDVERWVTNAKPVDLIEGLKTGLPASADPKSFLFREEALSSGPAIRFSYRYTSPRTGQPAIGTTWLVRSPRGNVDFHFRADADQASALDDLSRSVAASVRPLPGRRHDEAPEAGLLDRIAIVIDASTAVSVDWLEAEKDGVIDFVSTMSRGSSVTIVASGGATPRLIVPRTVLSAKEPIADAIRSIAINGEPNAAAAIALAKAEITKPPAGGQLLVMAATDGGLDGASIRASFQNADHTSDAALQAVALGRGPHEAQLFALAASVDAPEGYAVAPTPAEVGHALVVAEPGWNHPALPIGGGAVGAGGAANVLVPAGARAAMFAIEAPSWAARLSVIDPAGGQRGLDASQPDAYIVEGERRTTITVLNPSPGQWSLEAGPAASTDAVRWSAHVFGVLLITRPPLAQAQYGSGGPLDVAGDVSALRLESEADVTDLRGTVTVQAPGGMIHRRPLDVSGSSLFEFGGATTLGTTTYVTGEPGSYRLILDFEGKDSHGLPFRVQNEVWQLVARSLDSDGDGFPDDWERLYSDMDPHSAADSRTDVDQDGLSLAREFHELDTDPWKFDTDGGKEGDGSEVAAGRDPKDPSDDRPVASCLDNSAPTPEPSPAASYARDAAVESQLPESVLGHPTTRMSVVGRPDAMSFFGPVAHDLARCVGATDADVTIAIAIPDFRLGITAFKVRGASGDELMDAFRHRIKPGAEDELQLRPEEFEGRRYLRSESFVFYAAGDTLYWVTPLLGDGGTGASFDPVPTVDELFHDILRQLPRQ